MSRLSEAAEWYDYLSHYHEYLYDEHRDTPKRRFIYRWRLRRARELAWKESGAAFKAMLKVMGEHQ